MTVRGGVLTALVLLGLEALPARGGDAGFRAIAAQRLPTAVTWAGFQFLQADARGHVFVLDGDSLALFEIDSVGDLRKKSVLALKSESKSMHAWEAAMGAKGDWLLWQPPNELRYFHSGEEAPVPTVSWAVSAVGLLKGAPILGVLPASVGAPDAPADPRDELTPVVLIADDSKWNLLISRAPFERENRKAALMQEVRAACGVHLASADDDTFWLSHQDAYLLTRYSAQGQRKEEIRVGDGKVHWTDRSDADWKVMASAAQAQGQAFHKTDFAPVRSVPVNRAIAAGGDGRLYLLVESEDGLALDRYDPVESTLERVRLAGVDMGPGRLNLAAGQDALYLGGRTGGSGRWRIAWESLEAAAWRPVPEAFRNGMPLNQDRHEQEKKPAAANRATGSN